MRLLSGECRHTWSIRQATRGWQACSKRKGAMASPNGGGSIVEDVNASIGGDSCLVSVSFAAANRDIEREAFKQDCYSTFVDGLLDVS